MLQIESSIQIAAPSHQVWAILSDFPIYPEWNPFVREVRGEAVDGRSLSLLLQPKQGRSRRLWLRVRSSQPPWELQTRGSFLSTFLIAARHRFRLLSLPDGTTQLIQTLQLSGLLVPLFQHRIDHAVRAGFEAMNAALKTRAEARG